jgi:ferrous iron transport protein A
MTVATLLSDLPVGQWARVATWQLPDGLGSRLHALGMDVGKRVTVLRRAALKGPLHVRVGMTEFMLRHADAQHIQVEPIDTP